MNIGFYAEDQHYRPHAELLCESIRSRIPGARITIVVPQTTDGFLPDSFRPIADRVLSLRYVPSHPFTDKIHAAALFEESLSPGEPFLWMDIEGYFLKTPDFTVPGGALLINPVDIRNVGIPADSPWTPLWSGILRHFGRERESLGWGCRETVVTKEKIRPYFNVGFVFVREPRGVFRASASAIDELEGDPGFAPVFETPLNRIFFHQAVFAVAAFSLYGDAEIRPLPPGFNYPLHLHPRNPAPADLFLLGSLRYDGNLSGIPLDPADWEKLPKEIRDRRNDLGER